MRTIKLFLIITLIGFNILKVSGESQYIFHHLTTNDGLSNNTVKAILRDSHGFLWLGTEFGLNRYDGYGFKAFLANPGDVNQLPANDIQGLSEDALGNVWINGSAYVVYNRDKDNFITDVNIILKKFGLKPQIDQKIYIDKNKNLVVINKNEINYCKVQSKTQKTLKIPQINLASTEISDDLNNLYIVDNDHFCWQVSKATGKVNKILLPNYNNADSFKNNQIKIFVDTEGCIWLHSRVYNYVYYKKANSPDWRKIFLNSTIRSQNNIISVVEGQNNQIWIATDHIGLFMYDKTTMKLVNITSDTSNQNSISSDNISSILIDNAGTLWVGHDKKGLSYYNESFQNFVNEQNNMFSNVSKIYELKNGNILFGTDGNGSFVLNSLNNQIKKLPIPNTAVTALTEDKKGRIWVGTFQQGLFCLDNNKLKHYTSANSNLSTDNIWSLIEDKYGNIWIGALGGKIQRYSYKSNSNIFDSPFQETKYVAEMSYDGDKTIYTATAYGLTLIDIEKETSETYMGNRKKTQQFNHLQIFNVFKDSRDLLWIGTNSGLTVWDLKKDSLFYFDSSNGLTDNITRGITEDNSRNIWVTTSNGISEITLNGNKIVNCRNFSIIDGLKTNYFNNHSICKLKNGKILAGTTEGYTIINPQKIAEKKQPLPVVYFTKMSIGNSDISVDSMYNGHMVLKKSIEQIDKLNLKYNDKLVTLEFTTNNLTNAEKVKYRYKIEGFNNQWIATRKNEISITSLPAGEYILHIKACNSDGVWNDAVKTLNISVSPPFYYSQWAMIIYILMALSIVWFIIYRGQKRHQLKMEEQRLQMVHEHELKINELKLSFFTNISHDLRTPLTLIITPLQALLKELNDENLKKKLEVMFKNAQQLLSLINSLLDFRKLDVGAEMLHLKPDNIVDLLNEIYSSFTVYAKERNIYFTISNSYEHLWIEYDPDKIRKSVINLLSNAFKYTPSGGTIEVSLFTNESDVCISVSDTGIGISDEDKKIVFNRFYQTSNNLKTTGSGIGLHIVSEYIKLHNGFIDIADNEPSGSIFTIHFPLVEAPSLNVNTESEFEEDYQEISHEKTLAQKPVILFVDDNQDLCEFIHDNLKNDYSVLIANDGQEALIILKQNDVNIVVSDIMMPVMDGIELCKQIKTNIEWSHIPVILLTAKTADEHKIEGLENGADEYITKPFNMDILRLRILKFFEWSIKSHKTFKQKLDVNPHEITITSLDEKLIEKAILIVEKHMSDTLFSVEMLGENLGLSRGHLYKKLIAITGKGPAEFIRTIRLKRAMQLLEKSQMQIAEIAYEVGFNSPKRFSINFKEEFGISPSEYIRKMKLENES